MALANDPNFEQLRKSSLIPQIPSGLMHIQSELDRIEKSNDSVFKKSRRSSFDLKNRLDDDMCKISVKGSEKEVKSPKMTTGSAG